MKQFAAALVLGVALFPQTAHAQEIAIDRPATTTAEQTELHRHRFSIAPQAMYFFSSAPSENFTGAGIAGAFFLSERWALTLEGDFLQTTDIPSATPTLDPKRWPVATSAEARGKAMAGAEFEILRARRSLSQRGGSPVDIFVAPRVGLIWTRPVSLVDPAFRDFSYHEALAFEVDAGARLFVSSRLAVTLEAGWLVYNQQIENGAIPASNAERADSSTWYDAAKIRNGLLLQLGVAFLAP